MARWFSEHDVERAFACFVVAGVEKHKKKMQHRLIQLN